MREHLSPFLVLLLVFPLLLSACSNLGYYSQAARGQLGIIRRQIPIDKILKDDAVDQRTKQRLKLVLQIRNYAESNLSLPVGDNYLAYAEINGTHVVWNVFAAEEFSLVPYEWCYVIIGCMTYRGYFDQSRALRYGRELKLDGYDIFVGGVAAYSTLGWLSDPVLSTFINRSDASMAALIFHELAHKVLYVKGDTAFNESFATAVENAGLLRWLAHRGQGSEFEEHLLRQRHRREFVDILEPFKDELRTVYASDQPESRKRQAKLQIIHALKDHYATLKGHWGGYEQYESWVNGEINNAKLLTISTYFDLVPAFDALLRQQGGDVGLFLNECKRIAKLADDERNRVLRGEASSS